jgi:hypothetical protein
MRVMYIGQQNAGSDMNVGSEFEHLVVNKHANTRLSFLSVRFKKSLFSYMAATFIGYASSFYCQMGKNIDFSKF